jgi:hypothetical protein
VVNVDVPGGNAGYLPRLRDFCARNGIRDVHVNTGRTGFAGAVNRVFGAVRGEFYFYLEDDWLFLRPVDLNAVLALMREDPSIHHIRFSKETVARPGDAQLRALEKSGELYLVPGRQVTAGGMELVESAIWSLNPHVARSSVMRECGPIPEGVNPESFLCKRYDSLFPRRGVYIFGGYGDPPVVRDIGRPHIFVRKMRTLLAIARAPGLLSRRKRMQKLEERLGRPFTG